MIPTQRSAFIHSTIRRDVGRRPAAADVIDVIFGYTGRQFDEEIGLQYNRRRYYDPNTGRFISTDPSGLDGGDTNLYRYVGNSPLLYTDPSGLKGAFTSVEDWKQASAREAQNAAIEHFMATSLVPSDSAAWERSFDSNYGWFGRPSPGEYEAYNSALRSEAIERAIERQSEFSQGPVFVSGVRVIESISADYNRDVAAGIQNPGLVTRAGASVIQTFFPPSEPSTIVTLSDGSSIYFDGGGPPTGKTIGAVMAGTGFAGALRGGFTAFGKYVAQEAGEQLVDTASGLPVSTVFNASRGALSKARGTSVDLPSGSTQRSIDYHENGALGLKLQNPDWSPSSVAPKGVSPAVKAVGDDVTKFLGRDARVITNTAGDTVFLSKDGLRRVRFDINNPSPHANPHSHVEIKVNGKWFKSGPLYPSDVTPK